MSNSLGQAAPPWQLWGNTQHYVVRGQPVISPVINNNQTLARVAYGRPETWRFMLHAVIVGGGSQTSVLESALAEVSFELIIGLGRSAIAIPSFAILQWDWSSGSTPQVNQPLYTTTALDSRSIPGLPAEVRNIDQIVGQDITVQANVLYLTDVPSPVPIVIDVSAQLSPNSHVRPDWFQVDKQPGVQFSGGEQGAR